MIPLAIPSDCLSLCHAAQQIFVCVSGGMDSTVLLDVIASAPTLKPKITVLHVNHGLSPHAGNWQHHVEMLAAKAQVPIHVFHVSVDTNAKKGLEAAAREARYNAFQSCAQKDSIFLLAHHADDWLETFFLRLLRGSQLRGLANMQMKSPFFEGFLVRPFLHTPRSHIEAYATAHQLSFVHDEMNTDVEYRRTIVRQHLLPCIKQHWPQFDKALYRNSTLWMEETDYLDKVITEKYQQCLTEKGTLNLLHYQRLEPFEKKSVLRKFILEKTQQFPTAQMILHVERNVIEAKPGAKPKFFVGQNFLSRFDHCLYYVCPKDIQKISAPSHCNTAQKRKRYFQDANIPFWNRGV